MQENYSIELKEVTVRKNNGKVLDDISLKIHQGSATVITGPLGSGKSTLLKVIASIILPDDGKVLINDKPYASLNSAAVKKFRKATGFVFQDSALWANKSIYQNLELPLAYHFPNMSKAEIKGKISKMLKFLSYDDDVNKRPSDISSGNCKLVAFARALIIDPDILFIDGPETSLDFASMEKVRSIIKELKLQGKTLVICTYDDYITSIFADYLVILFKNKIYAEGLYKNLIHSSDIIIQNIMQYVLDKAGSYDGDILDLMDTGFN